MKTVEQRRQDVAFLKVLTGDLARQTRIDDDPVAMAKFRADMAAGDIDKYAPLSGHSRTGNIMNLEQTLDSPITPGTSCNFCGTKGGGVVDRGDSSSTQPLVRCSRCRVVKYCNRDCQSKDWSFHKKDCKLLRESSKNTAFCDDNNGKEG